MTACMLLRSNKEKVLKKSKKDELFSATETGSQNSYQKLFAREQNLFRESLANGL
jgi:hypothetical protein